VGTCAAAFRDVNTRPAPNATATFTCLFLATYAASRRCLAVSVLWASEAAHPGSIQNSAEATWKLSHADQENFNRLQILPRRGFDLRRYLMSCIRRHPPMDRSYRRFDYQKGTEGPTGISTRWTRRSLVAASLQIGRGGVGQAKEVSLRLVRPSSLTHCLSSPPSLPARVAWSV
jgi:hypothetical protein